MIKRIVLGITGASGAIYAVRLLEVLLAAGWDVHVSMSRAGQIVLREELGIEVDLRRLRLESLLPERADLPHDHLLRQLKPLGKNGDEPAAAPGGLAYHYFEDFMAPIASGSFLTDGMVVCPCSGGTMSAIAHGTSQNLICRAADVHLKERRKLLLMPRETPLSVIQLENMRRCAEAGAIVLPAMPGFYHGVHGIGDLVDFVVARMCDQLGAPHRLMRRWGEQAANEKSSATMPR